MSALAAVEPSADEPISLNLPAQIEVTKLVDIISQTLDVSIAMEQGSRSNSTVRLSLREHYRPAELWDVLNQVLASAGKTTVLAGEPPIFHVVDEAEAAAVSRVVPAAEMDAQMAGGRYRPGFMSVLIDLKHLPVERAIEISRALLSQRAQVHAFKGEQQQILVSATTTRVRTLLKTLADLDVAGMVPEFEQYQPKFATPNKLQNTASAAWRAAEKMAGRDQQVEIMESPDSERLLLIAPQAVMPRLKALVQELDLSEPTATKSYRPRYFSIDDVADLIERILDSESDRERVSIVRDDLTSSLVIKATEGQHQRIQRIVDDLDQAPSSVRRVMRQFVIKHRTAEELAGVLNQLLEQHGQVTSDAGSEIPAPSVVSPPPRADGLDAGAEDRGAAVSGPAPQSQQPVSSQVVDGDGDVVVSISTDPLTNTVIAFGPPKVLDEIHELIKRLDVKQAQVELQITMVALSSSESFSLGIELAGQARDGSIEGNVSSLFGVSEPGNGGTARTLNNFTGMGGLVINPGDWAMTFNALETVNDGKTVVTTRIVIDNNQEASIDGVDQRPVSSTSANQSASITSFGGTSDAGTQITVTPQIGAADQVTLTYQISQSSFVGESIQAGDGAVLPPPRRADSITSVATVPDGHVIALGGLVSARESKGRSGVPLLGRIPVLGMLFGRESSDEGESRFYVFIRANVLRHDNFEDLKYLSGSQRQTAGIDDGWPELSPRFLD